MIDSTRHQFYSTFAKLLIEEQLVQNIELVVDILTQLLVNLVNKVCAKSLCNYLAVSLHYSFWALATNLKWQQLYTNCRINLSIKKEIFQYLWFFSYRTVWTICLTVLFVMTTCINHFSLNWLMCKLYLSDIFILIYVTIEYKLFPFQFRWSWLRVIWITIGLLSRRFVISA